MVTAFILTETGIPAVLAIIIACAIGFVCGIAQWLFVAYSRINAFIVTLATGEIFQGIVYVMITGVSIIGIRGDGCEYWGRNVGARVFPWY